MFMKTIIHKTTFPSLLLIMTSPIKSKTTVDVVCSYLRKNILDGTYKPQVLLPPERKF